MSYLLKQSQTARPLLFLMVDTADHISAKTGLSPTVTISKNGATFASPAGAVTELANGWYKVAGNATDTGTLGPLVLHATGSGADPSDIEFEVVAFDPEDVVRLGLTALPNVAAGANGGLPTGDAGGRTTVGAIAANAITATAINADAITAAKIADGAIDAATFAAGAIDAAAIATDAIGSAALAASAVSKIQTSVTAGAVASVTGAVGSVTGNVGGNVTGSVGSVVGAVGSVTAAVTITAASVQAIWDALTSALTTVGSVGKRISDNLDLVLSTHLPAALVSGRIDASVGAIAANAITATSINAAAITAAKFAADAIDANALATNAVTEIATGVWANGTRTLTSLSALAADIASAVWDALAASYNTALTMGAKLNASGAASDPWTAALPGAYSSGQAGFIVGTELDATVSSRSSHSAADVWAVATRALTDKAGFSLSAAGIQDIWDRATSLLTTAGSIGKRLADDINATISSRAAPGDAMTLDLTQAIPDSPTEGSVGDAFLAAEADGFGKWTLIGTTLTIYRHDGVTIARTFVVDSSTDPTERV